MNLELSERQQAVLRLIIQEYVDGASPVSSKSSTDGSNLGVSSATIRNEMATLEELGYLMQPHTSAGRVPTELGYRYFVEKLMEKVELPETEQRMITHQFHQARLEVDQWLRLCAAILAHISSNASVVTAPKSLRCHVKHLEIISIREHIVLLILVLQGGTVKQQILNLDAPDEQHNLSTLARQLTETWKGLDAADVAATPLPPEIAFDSIAISVHQVIVEMMQRLDARRSSDIYHDGLLNTLNQPEFRNRVGIERIVRAIEERHFVEQLVEEAIQHGGVKIIIGGEGKWQEMSEVGIVLARYGVDNKITGAMGVLGPVRMPYERTVSVVRYMSRLMSDLMSDLYT
ncbi:MAG: heat-inducible transcriptional repressor HrcA [Anaerolineae bacterium]|nr:heat-inducible transcriptional repressor HrcA [Anaerolineae bacterium]